MVMLHLNHHFPMFFPGFSQPQAVSPAAVSPVSLACSAAPRAQSTEVPRVHKPCASGGETCSSATSGQTRRRRKSNGRSRRWMGLRRCDGCNSIILSFYLSICLSIYLPIYLSICLSISIYIYLYIDSVCICYYIYIIYISLMGLGNAVEYDKNMYIYIYIQWMGLV